MNYMMIAGVSLSLVGLFNDDWLWSLAGVTWVAVGLWGMVAGWEEDD